MSPQTQKAGFSTIEALITILLVASTLVVYSSSLQIVRLVRSSENQHKAYRIAEKEMETLRSTDFSALPASGNFSDPQLAQLQGGAGTVTVTDLNSSLKSIEVAVDWNEGGTSKSVNLTTLIYDGGINSL